MGFLIKIKQLIKGTKDPSLDGHILWEKPTHHEESQHQTNEVHWIELFYDLVHVVAIFLLGSYLTDNPSLEGIAVFFLLFIVFWFSWGDFSFYNSLYVSRDIKHRILSGLHITTIMLMAAAIPSMPYEGFVYFVGAYAMNRFFMSIFYFRVTRYTENSECLALQMGFYFLGLSLLTIAAIFTSMPWSYVLLCIVLLLGQGAYVFPRLGIMKFKKFSPRSHHIAERFALLLLICLGETFFKLVIALSEKGVHTMYWDILLNYVLGGMMVFLLAWMYFDFVGNRIVRSQNKTTLMRWWYAHMFLMVSAVLIGVGSKAMVKVHYYDVYPLYYATLGCLGLIGYIGSLWAIHTTTKKDITHKFVQPYVYISGIVLVVLTWLTVFFGMPSFIGNVFYFLAVSGQLFLPISHAYSTFKRENKY